MLNELNERPFKQLPGNRREAFEQLDRPALGSLPVHPYRYVAIKTVKVNIDYHVSYEQHHYSVPHQYVGQQLELHAGDTLLQVYHQQQLVASHPRKWLITSCRSANNIMPITFFLPAFTASFFYSA